MKFTMTFQGTINPVGEGEEELAATSVMQMATVAVEGAIPGFLALAEELDPRSPIRVTLEQVDVYGLGTIIQDAVGGLMGLEILTHVKLIRPSQEATTPSVAPSPN